MADTKKEYKVMNVALWVAQILLAACMVWAASVKLLHPVHDVAAMWPWAGQVPEVFLKFTGLVDLLGAIGLILPALLRVQPRLTPVAAVCIIVLMICASAFHISRGEGNVIGVNIVFGVLAAFIAWGRFKRAHTLVKG